MINLKPYYCPNCHKFLSRRHVQANFYWYPTCKWCGSEVYSTKAILEGFVRGYIEAEEDRRKNKEQKA